MFDFVRYRPSFDEFVALIRSSSDPVGLVPVCANTLTPVSAFCKFQEGDRSFPFESVIGGERLPHSPPDDRGLPDLCFAFYDRTVIFDHINKTVAVVAHAHIDPENLHGCYEAACERVDRLVERFQQGDGSLPLQRRSPTGDSGRRRIADDGGTSREGTAIPRVRELASARSLGAFVIGRRLRHRRYRRLGSQRNQLRQSVLRAANESTPLRRPESTLTFGQMPLISPTP